MNVFYLGFGIEIPCRNDVFQFFKEDYNYNKMNEIKKAAVSDCHCKTKSKHYDNLCVILE